MAQAPEDEYRKAFRTFLDSKNRVIIETDARLVIGFDADKFRAFIPAGAAGRTECLSWLFWQMGSTPYLGGGFGHFYHYAPVKLEYAIKQLTRGEKVALVAGESDPPWPWHTD